MTELPMEDTVAVEYPPHILPIRQVAVLHLHSTLITLRKDLWVGMGCRRMLTPTEVNPPHITLQLLLLPFPMDILQ